MKSTTFKITLASIIAVFALTGCGKADRESGDYENKNTDTSVLTTTSVSLESVPATVTTSAEKTEDVQPDQTADTQSDKTEAVQQEQIVVSQPEQTEIAQTADTSVVQNESKTDAITEKQALDAIMNYCYEHNPGLKTIVDSGEHTVYWDVNTNDANEIVVLYRSYTAAQMRYYIDPVSGETYVTELVPGIIDEEQRTEEKFNVKDYLQ